MQPCNRKVNICDFPFVTLKEHSDLFLFLYLAGEEGKKHHWRWNALESLLQLAEEEKTSSESVTWLWNDKTARSQLGHPDMLETSLCPRWRGTNFSVLILIHPAPVPYSRGWVGILILAKSVLPFLAGVAVCLHQGEIDRWEKSFAETEQYQMYQCAKYFYLEPGYCCTEHESCFPGLLHLFRHHPCIFGCMSSFGHSHIDKSSSIFCCKSYSSSRAGSPRVQDHSARLSQSDRGTERSSFTPLIGISSRGNLKGRMTRSQICPSFDIGRFMLTSAPKSGGMMDVLFVPVCHNIQQHSPRHRNVSNESPWVLLSCWQQLHQINWKLCIRGNTNTCGLWAYATNPLYL